MTDTRHLILIVDDEPSIREMLSMILSHKGYAILMAEDGVEALGLLSTARPHVLISDLRMPRMDGFELLSIVRSRFPEIAVIAFSGHYGFEGSAVEELVADAYLAKAQYSLNTLFETIDDLISRYPVRAPNPMDGPAAN